MTMNFRRCCCCVPVMCISDACISQKNNVRHEWCICFFFEPQVCRYAPMVCSLFGNYTSVAHVQYAIDAAAAAAAAPGVSILCVDICMHVQQAPSGGGGRELDT
ncbi:hypothetical protein PV326_001856 [Microctonus aethiopoides]|nr:hypothetical protein PV326_001856 [Microctonus aethiopoides]